MSFLRETACEIIPNGVDLSLFQGDGREDIRKAYGVRDGQLLLLAIAAPFDERKGFSDVLAVARQVGNLAQVVMVGLTREQLRDLPRNVTGIMRTDRPEALVALYNAADCLVNPTYEDTYPTVNMEAIACGTPVAAYDRGGSVEQITQACGILTPYGNFHALAEAAVRIGNEKKKMARACRMHAQRHFDRNDALAQYMMLYHRMMGV